MTRAAASWRCARTVVILAGCTVGPAYHRPRAPLPGSDAYKEGAWKVASPSDAIPRGKWWTMFHEPELDALEARLNITNQTIVQALENYLAACAQIRAARAQYFPTVTAAPSATLSRGSGAFIRGASATATGATGTPTGTPGTPGTSTGTSTGTPGTPTTTIAGTSGGRTTTYALPADVSWAPDLFGRVRSTVRQRQYTAQASAADLESARLLAQATLAQTYFELRGQDGLQALLDATVKADEQILALTRSRYELGIGAEVDVVQAQLTLQTARVQATNAAILRAQDEHAIATLLGVPASGFTLPRRTLHAEPPAIPAGAPSQLLERRPDIAAAERQMAAANAAIGIGYAAYYPVLTLFGDAGLMSSTLGTLLSWPSRVWSIGASLAETVFDGGLRRATIDQAVAAYNASVAGYRQTVLTAFQQVEDGLAQARVLAAEIEQQHTAVALAQQALAIERSRYETGIDPYLNLMTQQTLLLSAQQALVSLEVQQMAAAVQLIQALGGGWEVSALPTPGEVTHARPRGR